MVPARMWRVSLYGWAGPHRKIEIEEADGGSSRQKEYDFAFSVHGIVWSRDRRGALHLGHTVLGRGSLDWEVVP